MNKTATLLLLCTLLCVAACEQEEGKFKDPRDKKIYKTVKIGEQIWMAENLNYEAEGSRCYNDSTAYCKKYGRLYNWETAMKSCPSGWHLPSKEEWEILTEVIGGKKTAGKHLKAISGWEENGNGTDAYGFSALPGGSQVSYTGYFGNVGIAGWWWSSSEYKTDDYAYSRYMHYHDEYLDWYDDDKNLLYNVRCLQD